MAMAKLIAKSVMLEMILLIKSSIDVAESVSKLGNIDIVELGNSGGVIECRIIINYLGFNS